MDAQRAAVRAYARSRELHVLCEYSEVETARRERLDNRPELTKAVAHAKRVKAVLVIARFDRLARNVMVTSQLLESGVEFVACDNPYANRMTVQMLAVMAEHESRLISERTKAARAVRKERGLPNHGHRFSAEDARKGQKAAALSHKRRAYEAYRDIAPIVLNMRKNGSQLLQIVAYLEELGQRNQYGRPIDVACVMRILKRLKAPLLPPFLGRRCPEADDIRLRGRVAADASRRAPVAAARDAARPIARDLCNRGYSTTEIAAHLNSLGLKTSRGEPWSNPATRVLFGVKKPANERRCTRRRIRERVAASVRLKQQQSDAALEPIFCLTMHYRSIRLGYREIAAEINSLGYRRRDGRDWRAHDIVNSLRRYCLRHPDFAPPRKAVNGPI